MTIRFLAAVAVVAAISSQAYGADTSHWTYEGHEGPAHWGEIDEKFAACGIGGEQSPVDLTGAVKGDPAEIAFHWNADADWTAVNNGHTIQENTSNGGTITLDGKDYQLVQYHFHSPSEHAITGKTFPMEVHFVHVAKGGGIAVLGAMIEGGGQNDLFTSLMDAAPKTVGAEVAIGKGDPAKLLPDVAKFYRYQGSLTTPPCSEVVVWTVLKDASKVSDAAIKKFQELYSGNARPLQKVGRRYLLEN